MVAILLGLLVAAAVLLWSGGSGRRLRTLLDTRAIPTPGTADAGIRPSGAEPEPGGVGTGRAGERGVGERGHGHGRAASARRKAPVADEELAFDLDLVAICLTAGLPIPVALTLTAEATDDRSGLRRIARAKTIGGEELGADDRLRPVLDVFDFSERTGVGPAPLIEAVAGELRDRSRRRRQEAAAALGVRLVVPLGTCILPAFLLLSVVPIVISLLADLTTVFR